MLITDKKRACLKRYLLTLFFCSQICLLKTCLGRDCILARAASAPNDVIANAHMMNIMNDHNEAPICGPGQQHGYLAIHY